MFVLNCSIYRATNEVRFGAILYLDKFFCEIFKDFEKNVILTVMTTLQANAFPA